MSLDVVVVGSGLAGMALALEASRDHRVTLITKRALGQSNTRHAQGGIAASLGPGDSPDQHARDTLVAGAGLCDPVAVDALTQGARAAMERLAGWGVSFDVDASGQLALGQEGAHSHRRILHAGGDATGAVIAAALAERARERAATDPAALSVVEHRAVSRLVAREVGADVGAGGQRVCGVELIAPDGARQQVLADVVVLATGGAGSLYSHSTNPPEATADGIALALTAGADVADLEFMQFHPTALAAPGSFLISEAVRGEGAVLRDARGLRFMPEIHPEAELAPRDVVARAIADVMARQGGAPVVLDATALGAQRLAERFPTIDAATRAAGFDWAREPIPITPAAHYSMGGVVTDLRGRTSVPGLWAAGEVARTGVHGANRLASNSLLEAVVLALRVAQDLHSVEPPTHTAVPATPSASHMRSGAPLNRADLQHLMWEHVGLSRDADGLRSALHVLDRAVAAVSPEAAGDAITASEDANLLLVARAVTLSALARTESAGAHFRSDDPSAWQTAGAVAVPA